MIHLPASVRVYLCLTPCDMRKSFDSLQALVREHLQLDAFAGHLFVFGSSGESVGNLRVSALELREETVKLAAGGVEGALFVFPAVVDQRPAVLMDHVADKLFGGALS